MKKLLALICSLVLLAGGVSMFSACGNEDVIKVGVTQYPPMDYIDETTNEWTGFDYNSHGLRLCAHEPFDSIEKAIENRSDIHSEVTVFETRENRLRVSDTDTGRELAEQVEGLKSLLEYYESCAAAGISPAAGK